MQSRLGDVSFGLKKRSNVQRLPSPDVAVHRPVERELQRAPVEATANVSAYRVHAMRMGSAGRDAQDGGLRAHGDLGHFRQLSVVLCRAQCRRAGCAMGRLQSARGSWLRLDVGAWRGAAGGSGWRERSSAQSVHRSQHFCPTINSRNLLLPHPPIALSATPVPSHAVCLLSACLASNVSVV